MNAEQTNFELINVSRRAFLGAIPAMGLILAVGFPRLALAADEPKYGADSMPHGWVDDPLVFVAIGTDGTVTITCHRPEMGQGVRTSLPMVVADELEADWSRVRVKQAQADEMRFGNQDTDGSRSVRHFFEPMRRCGAAARTMLEQAAAVRWGVRWMRGRRTTSCIVRRIASWDMATWQSRRRIYRCLHAIRCA